VSAADVGVKVLGENPQADPFAFIGQADFALSLAWLPADEGVTKLRPGCDQGATRVPPGENRTANKKNKAKLVQANRVR
jgi:hypothetical protein